MSKNSDDAGTSRAEKLEVIAQLLECSPDALRKMDRMPPSLGGAAELLTIWAELDYDQDRDRLLEFARALRKRP